MNIIKFFILACAVCLILFGCASEGATSEKNALVCDPSQGATQQYADCYEKAGKQIATCTEGAVTLPQLLIIKKIELVQESSYCDVKVRYEDNPANDYSLPPVLGTQYLEKLRSKNYGYSCRIPMAEWTDKGSTYTVINERDIIDTGLDKYCNGNMLDDMHKV